ncbi:MAG: OmpA family protein [Candidatus Eisenbacteria bacterium]
MRRLTLLFTVIVVAGGLLPVAGRGQPAADSTLVTPRVTQSSTPASPGIADTSPVKLIPVRRLAPGGVRIRSVHDRRPIIIIYPPSWSLRPTVQPPVPPQPHAPVRVDSLAHTPALTRDDLNRMEARLQSYMDSRLLELQEAQRASLAALPPPTERILVVPGSRPGDTSVIVVPPPAPAKPAADTVAARTAAIATPAPPATPVDTTVAGALRGAQIPAPPDTGRPSPPSVPTPAAGRDTIEIEREIVEAGLLRSVNILFEVNRATLLAASISVLNSLGYVLAKHLDLRIEIAGHTDSSGPDTVNLRLSQARAEAVRDYLVTTFSIDPERLVARGYGESRPIAPETSPTGRALNRRVEFVVLRGGEDR